MTNQNLHFCFNDFKQRFIICIVDFFLFWFYHILHILSSTIILFLRYTLCILWLCECFSIAYDIFIHLYVYAYPFIEIRCKKNAKIIIINTYYFFSLKSRIFRHSVFPSVKCELCRNFSACILIWVFLDKKKIKYKDLGDDNFEIKFN